MGGVVAVVLGAGSGSRVGARANKVYLPLRGTPLIAWSLQAFVRSPHVDRVVLVVRADEVATARDVVTRHVSGPVEVVVGGATRHASESAALAHLAGDVASGDVDVIAVHDGARPLVTQQLIADVIAAARVVGGAVPGIDLDDVAHVGPDGAPTPHELPARLVRVQTPQAFAARALLEAYRRADADGFAGTDTAGCVQAYGHIAVHGLAGRADNIKVTYPADLLVAERLLDARAADA